MTQLKPTLANATDPEVVRSRILLGTLLGCVSALGYTAANVFLKTAAEDALDPIWVSTVKTFPTLAGALLWSIWSWRRGHRLFPARRPVLELLVAGLFGQIAGNVLFQWSLGVVGLAITVPLCFGAIICSSVLLGRLLLNESVTLATMTSVGLLVAAIWILSLSADRANSGTHAVPSPLTPSSTLTQPVPTSTIAAAVVAACIAGCAYGTLGMVIRRAAVADATAAATTLLISGVGAVTLSLLSWQQQGWQGIQATTQHQWALMVSAGICNFIAFAALTRALQVTTLIYVNAINASQVAMAAAIGVLIFGERFSIGLLAGSTLTVIGLLIMPKKSARTKHHDRPNEADNDLGVQNLENRDSSRSKRRSSQVDSSSNASPDPTTSKTTIALSAADDVIAEAE